MSFLTDIFAYFFVAVGLGMVLNIPILIILHFLMPKAVLERYWKMPYFRPFELGLFTDTFYAPMRTVMLMGAIAFPRLGTKRNITEVHTLAPQWYRIAAKGFTVWVLVLFAGFYVSMTGLTVCFWLFTDTNPWQETVGIVFSLSCFGGVGIYQWRLRHRESDSETRTNSGPVKKRVRKKRA